MIATVATTFGLATDFSAMSTEELMQMRGTVPVAERAAFQAEMQKRMQSMTPQERQRYKGPGKGMGMGQGRGMGMGQGMGQGRMAQMPSFADFDSNSDGFISEDELNEAQAKRMSERAEEGRMMKNAGNAPSFKDIDSDNDGKITPTEFRQHQMQQVKSPKNK